MNVNTNWHSWSEELLLGHFKVDRSKGLSASEASRRTAKNGPNRIWRVKHASAGRFAIQTLLDLSTVLLLIFAVITAVFEKNTEIFAIIGVTAFGGALRVLAYIRAQRIFEEKARGVIPRVRVIRGGEVKIVNAERLVTGDIVFLEAGDTVPADLRVLQSSELLVYENKITENKTIVFKNADVISEDAGDETPIEKRENMLYAGSTVVSGEARAVVVATGAKTLASSKYGTLLIPSGEKIQVCRTLSDWCRRLSLVMIGTVAVITVLGAVFKTSSAVELLLTTLALAVASMSEFFTVLGYIVIAVSVKKADTEECGRAKIKDASSVEAMNDVDTIVIESAGMLKSGDITLNSYYLGDRTVNVDEHIDGYSPDQLLKLCYLTTGTLPQGQVSSGFSLFDRQSSSVDYEAIHRVFDGYFKAYPEEKAVENTVIVGHEAAGSAESGGLDTVLICGRDGYEAIAGGPLETVLSCCTGIRKSGRVLPLTKEDTLHILSEAERLRSRGIQIVAVSRRDSPYRNMNRVSALQMCMTFEGFIAVSDRVHGDALDVIRKCRESTTRIVCFTEGSAEDRAFLKLVGILEGKSRYITLKEAAECDKITLEEGEFAAIETGWVESAKRRREFLHKLKEGGASVSYISKEPSDMWAVKEVPVSFAVPEAAKIKKTIPQALRSAAHVVVTPSENGGGVYESFRALELAKGSMMNLRRAAEYLIASQSARFIFTAVTAFTKMKPVDPVHILILGLVIDFSVIILTAYRDPPWDMISVKKEKRRLPKSFSDFVYPLAVGAVWSVLVLAAPVVLTVMNSFGIAAVPAETCESMIFSSVLISSFFIGGEMMTNSSLFKRSKRRSAAIPLSFVAGILLSLVFSFSGGINDFFKSKPLSFSLYALTLIPAAAAVLIFEIRKACTTASKT